MTLFILVGLVLSSPANSGEEALAHILAQKSSGEWIIQYGSRRMTCEATRLCEDFRDGIYLRPHQGFSRPNELVEYATINLQWNDCVVRNCKDY